MTDQPTDGSEIDPGSLPGPNAPATERLKYELRDYYRLKFGTDYCWVHKYGELHVLCPLTWKNTIEHCAALHEVRVTTWYTY